MVRYQMNVWFFGYGGKIVFHGGVDTQLKGCAFSYVVYLPFGISQLVVAVITADDYAGVSISGQEGLKPGEINLIKEWKIKRGRPKR